MKFVVYTSLQRPESLYNSSGLYTEYVSDKSDNTWRALFDGFADGRGIATGSLT